MRILIIAFICFVIAAVVPLSLGVYTVARTLDDLFRENEQLRQSLGNLTHEDQIGYAKVLSQETHEGQLFTKLLFVETDRDDKTKRVVEKEVTIAGDVVHFDAMIIKFSNELVIDGRARALYMWRRVYGENTAPQNGVHIAVPGRAPERYAELLGQHEVIEQDQFWEAIWTLAESPDALREFGITATYGNAIYTKLRPGLVYIFKISKSGQVYPETVPDL